MEHAAPSSPPRSARLWISLGIFAIGTFMSAILTRQPIREAAVTLACLIGAVSVFGVAMLMAPVTPYPRWAHWAAGAVLAGWILVSPLVAGDPHTWRADIRPVLWFMPWYVLTFATMPARLNGACATESRRAGWMMVAVSVVMGGVLMFAGRVAQLLRA